MKENLILLFLLVTVTLFSTYNREQVARYAHRYTRLTEGKTYAVNIFPDSMYFNVNPFIISLENGTGYINGNDCAHFVSQCLQAGGIPMYEDNHSDNANYLGYVAARNLHNFAVAQNTSQTFYPRVTFKEDFFMYEELSPHIESSHPYSIPDARLLTPAYETDFFKIHFMYFDINPTWSSDRLVISGYDWQYDTILSWYNNTSNPFWSYSNLRRWVFSGNSLLLQFQGMYGGMPSYNGYECDSLQWRGKLEPVNSYETGDFQIFCNYRPGALHTTEDNLFGVHYNTTYNDSGYTVRYRHAAICRSGSGTTARVSAHNRDRNDRSWDYAYCHSDSVYNSLAWNSIAFYEVDNNLGEQPNLCAYNQWGENAVITTTSPESEVNVDNFAVGDTVYVKYSFQNNGDVMVPDRFKVNLEYGENQTLIDSVLHNGILIENVKIDTLLFAMSDMESITITVRLDAGQGRDSGADWEATWNDQNWAESDSLDNILSKTIYLETGLQTPTNVEIEVDTESDSLHLQWEGNRRSTYKVYSSTNPYTDFEEDLTGIYSGTSWSAPFPSENRFYYVVETDGRNERKSKSVQIRIESKK
jgi:hypothetical protein